jgi:alkanesulfonate monooxygenase
VHIITGGSDGEQRRDGDHLSKDERYDRTDEYLDVLVRAWTSDGPFGYQGRYYQVEDAYADVASVRAAAAAAGRDTAPRISVSFRPIIGATEELAWERAHQILATTRANIEEFRGQWRRPAGGLGGARPQNRGSQRLLAAAAKGELHDRALWTPLAAATGAAGNSTALVGTPDTVAQALLDYVGIGVSTLLIRGYDPYDDAIDYGRHLLPLVRDEIARRERRPLAAVAGGATARAVREG